MQSTEYVASCLNFLCRLMDSICGAITFEPAPWLESVWANARATSSLFDLPLAAFALLLFATFFFETIIEGRLRTENRPVRRGTRPCPVVVALEARRDRDRVLDLVMDRFLICDNEIGKINKQCIQVTTVESHYNHSQNIGACLKRLSLG